MTFTRLGALGGSGDPSLDVHLAGVVRDRGGSYYAGPTVTGSLAVYDSVRRFVRMITGVADNRPPFQRVSFLAMTPGDTLYVVGVGSRRESWITAAGTIIRSRELPAQPYAVLPLGDGRVVYNAVLHSADRIGFPLHINDPRAGGITLSFGSQAPASRPDFPTNDLRMMTLASNGDIWSARANAYQVERWTQDGHLRERLTRSVRWFVPRTREMRGSSTTDMPEPGFSRILWRADGRLLTLLRVPDKNWAPDSTATPVGEGGRRRSPSGALLSRFLDSIVELIDPNSGVVIASGRSPVFFPGIISDDLLYAYENGPKGETMVAVWRINVR